MEETLIIVERFGFTLVAAVAMAIALYKIVMFALVGRANEFRASHEELHDMQIKTLERLTDIEKDFAMMTGKLELISEYVKKKMME